MAKPEVPPGQEELHAVENTVTGETAMWTQAQWKTRDKSAGWVRVDEEGEPLPEEE